MKIFMLLYRIYVSRLWNVKRYLFLQGRGRDADIEDGLLDTAGEGEGGKIRSSTDIYTPP